MEVNKKGIILPTIYTKETWERGGKRKEHKKYIGKYYVSWSQIESFNDKAGFNTGLLGVFEYLRKYFLKEKYPDMGWGDHGTSVEAYITVRSEDRKTLDEKTLEALEWADRHFTKEGKALLDTIEPLGVFQYEICYYIKELDVIVLGYIDDMSAPDAEGCIKMLRDYKTKSESSKKDLHLPKKFQIEIYSSALEQLKYKVQNSEYCIIDRSGGRECMEGGGKEALNIGKKIWYEPYRALTKDRKKEMDELLINTVTRISEYFKCFNSYFNVN